MGKTAKTTQKPKSKAKLNMRITLILFALLPLLISSVAIGVVSIVKSESEIKTYTHDSLVQMVESIGGSFDSLVDSNSQILQAYSTAPVLKEALEKPNDAAVAKSAEQYTLDFFGKIQGWEGLYLADWDTKVYTHPNEGAIGMVLREGDALKSLQDSLTSADGVFNTGIMASPVSGQLIMSMYCPIMANDKPIGFVGGAFYVGNIAEKISDVSGLGLSSAYTYIVDNVGTMLFHPDETKIGNPVENEAVKGLVAKLENGEMPDPDLIEYEYKGVTKYAGYYIGDGGRYIAVLTADESDVLSGVAQIRLITIIICVACVIVFAIIALLVERVISVPLIMISKSLGQLSTGDVTVTCDAKSHIKETISIRDAFDALKEALDTSMRSVKTSAAALNDAIISVDDMTSDNVESISGINSAINEVATTSQSVALNAQTMSEKATDLGEDVEGLNKNVQTLTDESKIIRDANDEATECMKSVYAGAKESVEAMQSISDKITETNSAIGEIVSAIQAIEDIASQTNLLSLNASIEAARAGEAGRGFAVVADEIRALADSSAESAKEIKGIIGNVTTLSNSTVEISNRVFEVISKEQSDIEMAQEKFNQLSESVEATMGEIETIRMMTEKLDAIKVDLTSATTELGSISEELGANAEEVASTCQIVTDACVSTQESTSEMREVNEDMSSAIEFFKVD